jgi:hypothetical protein
MGACPTTSYSMSPAGSDRAAHRPRPSESCRVLGRALTRLMPGAGTPGVVRFRRIGLPGPGLLLVDVPGCARHCAPPVWRARCLTTAQDVDAGVHRLRSAHRARRADGCRNHGAAIPAEPSPSATARRCGAWPLALALRPSPRPPLRAAAHALLPARLGGLKLCRGCTAAGRPPDHEALPQGGRVTLNAPTATTGS